IADLVGGEISVLHGLNDLRTLAVEHDNQCNLAISKPQGFTLCPLSAVIPTSGTISVASGNLTLNQTGTTPSFTNTGTITIASGHTFTVNGGTFNATSGSLTGPGVFDVNNLTLAFNTAAMTAPINMTTTSIAG